ncbi:MAG: hypothetical protein ACREI3_02560 [Nitrospirales bacterium]
MAGDTPERARRPRMLTGDRLTGPLHPGHSVGTLRARARRILKDGGWRYPLLAGYFLFVLLLSMGLEWLPTWLPSR